MRPAGAGPADPRLRLPSAPRAPARGGGPGGAGRRGDRRPAGGRPWPGAFPPRRCAATGSGSAGKASGGQVARLRASGRPGVRAPGQQVSPNPGAEGDDRRRALPPAPPKPAGRPSLSGGGAPRPGSPRGGRRGAGPAGPRRRCQPGRTALSALQPRGAAGPCAAAPGRPGSAAMSATHPTRLETRTKESSTCASQGPCPESPRRNEGEGRRAPAEVGSRGACRREAPGAPPARLARAFGPGRWSVSVRARTRKMVNYAWAGRSQRKLWWRSVAVLTCKSVVRPGSRGERLIEPSSSWFPPKFPSG